MMKDNQQVSGSETQDSVPDTVHSNHEAEESTEAGPLEKPEPLYCVLSERRKIASILVAAAVGFLTPTSSDIYYPALDVLAHDLGVSKSKINISIVLFLIVSGIVPLFTGRISDQKGRRPVLIACFLVYILVNIGLALQTSYAALMVLRCLQSAGCTGSSVVSVSIVADLRTRAERGKYMAYSTLGFAVGPAIGPVVGGILTKFLGWRSIFWFLAIYAGVVLLIILGFLPETCRVIVGNGSLPAQPWNRPLCEMIGPLREKSNPEYETRISLGPRMNIFDGIGLIFNREFFLLVLSTTLFYCWVMAIMSTIPALLSTKYNYNSLEVGLCYLPYAVGGFATRWVLGGMTDWNYRRHARKVGIELQKNRQSRRQVDEMPLEKARLEIVIPLVYLSCASVLGYAWVLNFNVHIAAPLVFLFCLGISTVGMVNVTSALTIDLHVGRPGTAQAVSLCFRYLVAAGVVAGGLPLVNTVGIGWVGTIIAGGWFIVSIMHWVLYFYGHDWRKEAMKGAHDNKE